MPAFVKMADPLYGVTIESVISTIRFRGKVQDIEVEAVAGEFLYEDFEHFTAEQVRQSQTETECVGVSG